MIADWEDVTSEECCSCKTMPSSKPASTNITTPLNQYKGKADAEQKLFVHLTTNPKVKIDGVEEEHSALKTKNEPEIRNVVQWILSR